jgi:hypothetical protein
LKKIRKIILLVYCVTLNNGIVMVCLPDVLVQMETLRQYTKIGGTLLRRLVLL